MFSRAGRDSTLLVVLNQIVQKIINIFRNSQMLHICIPISIIHNLCWVFCSFWRMSVHRVCMRKVAWSNDVFNHSKCNHIFITKKKRSIFTYQKKFLNGRINYNGIKGSLDCNILIIFHPIIVEWCWMVIFCNGIWCPY